MYGIMESFNQKFRIDEEYKKHKRKLLDRLTNLCVSLNLGRNFGV